MTDTTSILYCVRSMRNALAACQWAAQGIWLALTDQDRQELLADAATDRLGTSRERPGDSAAEQSVDAQAMFRLISYGLVTENGRRGEPLLTEVGRAVVAWVETHQTAAARDGSAGVAAEDSTEENR